MGDSGDSAAVAGTCPARTEGIDLTLLCVLTAGHLGMHRDPSGTDWSAQPCGSMRVTERVEGYEYRTRWCERTGGGPCPFPGTDQSRSNERPCQAQSDGSTPHGT